MATPQFDYQKQIVDVDGNIVDFSATATSNTAIGATTDAAVITDTTGTLSGKLRGLVKFFYERMPASLGQKTAANSLAVVLASDGATEAHLGEVGGRLASVSAEFTRPSDTTAYAVGDVVSDSTSATTLLVIVGCARVNQGSGYITGARLITDKKSITPRIRVHVYNASNPTRAADNVAMDIRYADISKRIGAFDMPAMTTGTDTTNSTSSQAQDMTLRVPFVCAAATTTLYFLFEALDIFTPASAEKFTLVVFCEQH
jgi:hypothetical protein